MIPEFQHKPAKRLTYKEKCKAGLVAGKPRQALRKAAKGNAARDREYREWVKIAMHGLPRCQRCAWHVSQCGPLQPHHPSGRCEDRLFEVVQVCTQCHAWIHEFPNLSYAAGWLTPAYRGYAPHPNHPQPFTLLPPP
jgi:hypothetical protein